MDQNGEAEKAGLCTRRAAQLNHWLRNREFIVRDDDRLQYLQFSRRRQISALAGALVLGAWLLAATAGSLWWALDLGAERQELREQRLANLELLSEVGEYHQEFARIIGTLEGNQTLLLTRLDERSRGTATDGGIRAQLKDIQDDKARMLVASQALKARLARFRGELTELALRDVELQARLQATQRTLLETRAEGAEVAAARLRLGRVLSQTEAELARQAAERSRLESDLAAARQALQRTGETAAAAQQRLQEALGQAEVDLAGVAKEKSEVAQQLAATRQELDRARDEGAELATARERLDDALRQTDGDLARLLDERLETDRQLAEAQRDLAGMQARNETLTVEKIALRAEVQSLYREVAIAPDSDNELKAQVSALGVELDASSRQIASLQAQRDSYLQRAEGLEVRLDDLSEIQTAVVQRLTERTLTGTDMLERLVAMTGLNVNELIGGMDIASLGLSQGGPYIGGDYVTSGDPQLELQSSVALLDQQMDRWEALQEVVRSIPLSSPLDQYKVSSGYGERKDPVNGRRAIHYGIDLKAPLRTPVMATAPGTVVFAGWKGYYGRMIVIDHGNGIRTRYAHLRKILVKTGQVVALREKIALLGSSGRSTGPHVHYEIVVGGESYDPARFVMAGRNAFKD